MATLDPRRVRMLAASVLRERETCTRRKVIGQLVTSVSSKKGSSQPDEECESVTDGNRTCSLMTSSPTNKLCIALPVTSFCGSQNGPSVTPRRGQEVNVMGIS